MKATECMVMAGIMIGGFGCSSMLPKMDASRAIQDGGAFVGYMQGGKVIDRGDMADKLALEPDAAPHVQNARALKVVSTILAATSGALIGLPLGQWAGGSSHPNWKLAAIGGGVFAIALPLAIWSDSCTSSAVEAHNKRFAAAPFASLTSTDAWKPGERAEARSTHHTGAAGFDAKAALAALQTSAPAASNCASDDDILEVQVAVTFDPSGKVTSINFVGDEVAKASTKECVVKAFQKATVPAFEGESVTVKKKVTVGKTPD